MDPSLAVSNSPVLIPPPTGNSMNTPLVHMTQNSQAKDSRWLTLEVCRENQRSKCSRTENECKFAHPPPHVEVTNGRVVCCYDSIKGKCQRKEPPCKYLHPPQHLREQLLQNGRNNLILKNIQMQIISQSFAAQNGMQGGLIALAQPATLAAAPTGVQPYLTSAAAAAAVAAAASAGGVPSPMTAMPSAAAAAFGPFMGNNAAALPLSNASCSAADLQQLLVAHSPPSTGAGSVSSAAAVQLSSFGNAIPPPGHKAMMSVAGREQRQENMGLHPYGLTAAPKRPAVADLKSGLPVYQPSHSPVALAAYQQALANSGMHHLHSAAAAQQTFFPSVYSPAMNLQQFLQ